VPPAIVLLSAIALAACGYLRLLESPNGTDPAVEGATRLITGKLVREGESVRAALQLRDPVKDALLWETEISSDGGDLSALASRLAMHTIEQMGVSLPDRYDYIGAVTGGTEMSESPLTARAQESWRRNDIEALLETSTTLVDQYPDDPAAHVLNAWALMFAWDATPSTEDYLSQLRERLVTLDRVDPSSPYDELIRGYIYRSSGQPEQARASYSQVLTRTDISSTARAWALRQRSFTYLQVGNAEAAVSLDRACRLSDSQEACANLAVVLHRGGREEEARTAATHAESLAASGWGYYNLACFWSLAGKRTQAIDGLSRSLELGFADALLDTDPDLDSLRDDPGFQAILEAVEDRLNSRRQLTKSVFPWQARIATSPSVSPA
jgi:tetratricopeptide (TPR) repeat protein